MMPRALLCDVYQTLLEVMPAAVDPEPRWAALWSDYFGDTPRPPWGEVRETLKRAVAVRHATARAAGVRHPEVWWPAVVQSALPQLRALSDRRTTDFIAAQIELERTVRLMPGAVETLEACRRAGVRLGLVSNAQAYTVDELRRALIDGGSRLEVFEPSLCIWSYRLGFSKPDPHFFRVAVARLEALGIGPGETLMVGDRTDNDLEPARVQGWQFWRMTPCAEAGEIRTGPWPALRLWLETGLANRTPPQAD